MARPRTVNKNIKALPQGMRKIGNNWHWRGTNEATHEIAAKLKAGGLSYPQTAAQLFLMPATGGHHM